MYLHEIPFKFMVLIGASVVVVVIVFFVVWDPWVIFAVRDDVRQSTGGQAEYGALVRTVGDSVDAATKVEPFSSWHLFCVKQELMALLSGVKDAGLSN